MPPTAIARQELLTVEADTTGHHARRRTAAEGGAFLERENNVHVNYSIFILFSRVTHCHGKAGGHPRWRLPPPATMHGGAAAAGGF